MSSKYIVSGVMSGTSCDGLDLALCSFVYDSNTWTYKIIDTRHIPFDSEWKNNLSRAFDLSNEELFQLNHDFGAYIGSSLNEFHQGIDKKPDLIASHGHTVFHRPVSGRFSLQIGSGAAISANTGIDTVTDFRSSDISLGGQGAPLVPVGDKLLFNKYKYCLNLGGIANISFDKENSRKAFDICPANMALNFIANSMGLSYDDEGTLASEGDLSTELLDHLNKIEFYHLTGPRSLGREWFEGVFIKELDRFQLNPQDLLRTLCEHISIQIESSLNSGPGEILVTGGGTHNLFLMDRLNFHISDKNISIPQVDRKLIDYKEALIFAFLGVLRLRNEVNTYSSVTGASRDSTGGCIYKGT